MKDLIKVIALVYISLILSNCSSIELNERGRSVAVKSNLSDSERADYEHWKVVRCEMGANGRSLDTNRKACENSLRNQAAELGAALITTESKDDRSGFKWGNRCNNCVNEIAHVYRKKPASEAGKEVSKKEDESPIRSKIDIPDLNEPTKAPSLGEPAPTAPTGLTPTTPRAPSSAQPPQGRNSAPKGKATQPKQNAKGPESTRGF